MVERILVPIDFSPVSKEALRYALQFAEQTGGKNVEVLHVYSPQTAPDAIVVPPTGKILEENRIALNRFVTQIEKPAQVALHAEVQLGFPKDEIIENSKEYDLIIMGTTGESGILEQVFGNVASDVAQNAHCPVLLIPEQSIFKNYRQIVYAGDDISLSQSAVEQLAAFNDLFHARIHFIHVDDKGGDAARGDQEKIFSTLFTSESVNFAFDIGQVEADSVEEGLRDYIADHPIDLLVMVTQKRGFWDSFFHRSQAKQIALDPELPVLFLHFKEEDQD